MAVALEVEQAVAGYVNTHRHGEEFTIENIRNYIMSLWNCGCGPIVLNFNKNDLIQFLESCKGICLSKDTVGKDKWKIDKSYLAQEEPFDMEDIKRYFDYDEEKIRKFKLFCKLRVRLLHTPDNLLDAMGFRFMYTG